MMTLLMAIYFAMTAAHSTPTQPLHSGKCWRSNIEAISTVANRVAVGFIFANDKLVIVNPSCKDDHYNSTMSENQVELLRGRLLRSPGTKDGNIVEIIGFRSTVDGRVFREHGINLFLGKIENPVTLPPGKTMKIYEAFGGR